jgi:hypothetical protein
MEFKRRCLEEFFRLALLGRCPDIFQTDASPSDPFILPNGGRIHNEMGAVLGGLGSNRG